MKCKSNIRDELFKYIRLKNQTNKELAKDLGYSTSYISKILSGTRTPSIKFVYAFFSLLKKKKFSLEIVSNLDDEELEKNDQLVKMYIPKSLESFIAKICELLDDKSNTSH